MVQSLTKFYWVLPSFTGFYLVFLGFTQFYWVLPSFTGFYLVLLGFTQFYWVLPSLTGFYLVLLGFTQFYWVLPCFTGFYLVLLGYIGFLTGFYLVLLSFPQLYCVQPRFTVFQLSLGFTRFYRVLPTSTHDFGETKQSATKVSVADQQKRNQSNPIKSRSDARRDARQDARCKIAPDSAHAGVAVTKWPRNRNRNGRPKTVQVNNSNLPTSSPLRFQMGKSYYPLHRFFLKITTRN